MNYYVQSQENLRHSQGENFPARVVDCVAGEHGAFSAYLVAPSVALEAGLGAVPALVCHPHYMGLPIALQILHAQIFLILRTTHGRQYQ